MDFNIDLPTALYINWLKEYNQWMARGQTPERDILFSLRKDDRHRIIFTLENSCDSVKLDDGIFSSIKENASHGFGLRNIENCVKKYNGIMKVSF